MANLIRSAKSSSGWTLNELDSYHISLNQLDALSFFGLKELPSPSVDSELLANSDASATQQDHHAQLLTYLDLTIIPEKEEPAVLDFTVALFKNLGYVRRQRVARTRVNLPLLICGENKHAQADALLLNTSPENDILLLVQACKRLDRLDPVCTKAQLVAQAVAAFNENNAQREAAGYPPIEGKGSDFVSLGWCFLRRHVP
ncbi:hypothetical protein ONZ45_g16780 [Pleurotus djamor]|nr:hypothetical protein ONZ45_g16780 [Pleurotus djamor]